MNEQTLELQIKTTADGAVNSVKLLNSSLGNTKQTVDKVSTSVNKLGKAFSLGGLYIGAKRLTTQFLNWMNLAIDRTEQLNLFNVVFKNIEKNGEQTFSELGKSATKFQNTLNETFGTNFTDTTKYQGLFQSMAQNVGIADNYSAIMSETMTKLTYDLGSLYNKAEKDVAEALRAGVYAGQTKPLRAYGIDVTQTSLTPVAESLGITDRSVKEMSQAEKEILRYIATLRQARIAMGDYANTIESPANQTKVFKNTLVEAKVALTSLFIGTFSKILPYANAILMVIKEVSKAIATMFGIKIQDYNTGIATQAEAYDGLGESIDGATDSAKKLKREILSFDQIHNINEDNDSGSGSGGASGLSGGIDQRLLDAINGYDNGMDKVRMKATEIRDKIMEWLGFTKHINTETGETYFTLDNTDSTMYKIISALKGIIKYGKEAIAGVFNVIKKDFDNGTFGKVLVGVFETIKNLFKFIAEHKSVQTIVAKLLETFIGFKVISGILNPIVKSIEKMITATSKLSSITLGITVQSLGITAVHDSVKGLINDGFNLISLFEGIAGTIATVGGSILTLTSLLGPVGVPLGVIVGLFEALASTTNALFDEETISDKINNVNRVLEEYETTMDELSTSKQKYLEKSLGELKHYEELYKELKLITDENGNIKNGYETRANFIVNELAEALGIEIKIVDGQIQKYDELEKRIYDVVNAKRAQYLVDANADKYNYAKDESIKLEKAYAEAVKNTHDALETANPTFKKLQEAFKLSNEELQEFINKGTLHQEHVSIMTDSMSSLRDSAIRYRETLELARESEEKAGKDWANNQKIIGDYESALGYLSEKNYSAVTKIYTDTINYQGKTKEETSKNYSYSIESQKKYLKELEDNKYKYDEDYIEQEKNRTKLKIAQLEEEQKQVEEEMNRQNEITKLKTLDGINKQLNVFKDHKYEFKEASNGNMQLYIDGIASGNTISQSTMTKLVDGTIQKIKDKKMSAKEAGEFLVDGVNLGLGNPIKQNQSYGIIGNFAINLLNTFKKKLGINSPSKITRDYGKYLIEGLNIGVDAEKKNTLNNIANFTKDIVDSMNTDLGRFEIDFNKSFSHSISNNIDAKSSINIGDTMANKISSQLAMAINNQTINVQLNAHTDEGVIIDRINQTTKQTGVCPINIPY